MAVPTIFAMGGGGCATEPDAPALDAYVLTLATCRRPRILFVPLDAGDEADAQAARFHTAFAARACHPQVLRLGTLGAGELRALVLEQDVIYLAGSPLPDVLAAWRAHGLDELLRDAWGRGIVLTGSGAAAMCWFEHGVTLRDGIAAPAAGLGLLPGSLSVHADSEPLRLPVYEAAVGSGAVGPGWALDDGVALLFRGAAMEGAVAARGHARACRVEPDGAGGVHRTSLLVQELALEPAPLRAVPGDVLEFRR